MTSLHNIFIRWFSVHMGSVENHFKNSFIFRSPDCIDRIADVFFYTQDSKSLCEFGDVVEFIAYGEKRCKQLGIEDDEEMAGFLFQAFDGEVQSWYLTLPKQV